MNVREKKWKRNRRYRTKRILLDFSLSLQEKETREREKQEKERNN